jgi:hypothetical protein
VNAKLRALPAFAHMLAGQAAREALSLTEQARALRKFGGTRPVAEAESTG